MVYAYINVSSMEKMISAYNVDKFILNKSIYDTTKQELTSNDTLFIESLVLLGSSFNKILKELDYLIKNNIQFEILDMSTFSSDNNELCNFVRSICRLQTKSKLKPGRPEIQPKVDFSVLYRMYLNGETKEAIELSGMSRATFYRKLEKYEIERGFTKRRNSSALSYGEMLKIFSIDMSKLEEYPLLKI